jgi:hypothetical protein
MPSMSSVVAWTISWSSITMASSTAQGTASMARTISLYRPLAITTTERLLDARAGGLLVGPRKHARGRRRSPVRRLRKRHPLAILSLPAQVL